MAKQTETQRKIKEYLNVILINLMQEQGLEK